ncbi:transposase [Schaalia cardiffensis]
MCRARRTLLTGVNLLNPSQNQRLQALFENDDHVPVEITWNLYQHMVVTYRTTKTWPGKTLMIKTIDTLTQSVSPELPGLVKLGPTLHKRRTDVLA